MTSWDQRELRRNIERLYGRPQREAIGQSLKAIYWRQIFAQYHFYEAKDLIASAENGRTDEASLVGMLLGGDEDGGDRFYSARAKAAANVIAFMQSIHAVSDALAHVLYHGLGMNDRNGLQLEERDIAMKRVKRLLANAPEAAPLVPLVKQLVGEGDYAYFEAAVNCSKHRSIVDTGYSVSFVEPGRRGMRLEAFTHGGITYPPRWVGDVLPSEYDRQSKLIVGIGRQLNQIVAEQCVARSVP